MCLLAGLTPGRVAEYLSREIPHRDVADGLLLDALLGQVDRFLDSGCGVAGDGADGGGQACDGRAGVTEGALRSEPVRRVLSRLAEQGRECDEVAKRVAAQRRVSAGVRRLPVMERAELHRDAPIAIAEEVGRLIYVLARGRSSRRIVEFGGSLGVSTIHLAAAIRDGGEGSLISTEIHPEKAAVLEANLRQAGLEDLVEVRVGDALRTLRELPGPVDLLFLDGWNELYLPVLQLLEPALSDDALVIADLSADDPDLAGYLQHVRAPQNGWTSVTVPLDTGVEISSRGMRA